MNIISEKALQAEGRARIRAAEAIGNYETADDLREYYNNYGISWEELLAEDFKQEKGE